MSLTDRISPEPDGPVDDAPPALQVRGELSNAPENKKHRPALECILSGHDGKILRQATMDPPINMASLRELLEPALCGNLRLRHDLNYLTGKVSFHTNRARSAEIFASRAADEYWEALRIELSICQQWEQLIDCGVRILARLPRLIVALRDIMIATCSSVSRTFIVSSLDEKLICQQIRHGVYDFEGLLQRLYSTLALRSRCEDPHIRDVLRSRLQDLKQRTAHWVGGEIIFELKKLFQILELVLQANAQIYVTRQRNMMLASFTGFEQSSILKTIKNGYTFKRWFAFDKWRSQEGIFRTCVDALVDLIVTGERQIPACLVLEEKRIKTLQAMFSTFIVLLSCRKVVLRMMRSANRSLQNLEHTDLRGCLKRIATILQDQASSNAARFEAAAVEIAREAHSRSGADASGNQLTEYEIETVKEELECDIDPRSPWHSQHREPAVAMLRRLVHQQVSRLSPLDNVKMAGLCQILATVAAVSPSASSTPADMQTFTGSCPMAVKLAHMAVLHWRVWAPLLYLNTGEQWKGSEKSSDQEEG